MPKVLRLHKTGSNVEGWAKTSQITSTEIKDMVDGAGGRAQKINASIPTPFARMHLFETAFDFVKQGVTSTQNSIYHKFVTHFWDLWELLYNHQSYAQGGNKIVIRRWNKHQQLSAMQANPNTNLLGKTLELFMNDSRFQGVEDLFLFYLEATSPRGDRHLQLLGGTSPLTFLFVSPNVQPLAINRAQNVGVYFDNNYISLRDRERDFQEYVHKLFVSNPDYIRAFPAVYNALDEHLLKSISMSGVVGQNAISAEYLPLVDLQQNPVHVGRLTFLVKKDQTAVTSSDLFLRPTNPLFAGDRPIVLKPDLRLAPHVKYVNNLAWPANTVVGYSDSKEIESRSLPGVGFNYPYLTINDLLQETIVQVPYEVNTDRFFSGTVLYQPGVTEKVFNYLLPVTSLYFQYFTPHDLATHLTFYVDVNHVRVTLQIPTEKGNIVYERSYYDNPLNSKDAHGEVIPEKGHILKSRVGIGVFPFYQFTDTPTYNDFYKVMLVDEDIDPLLVNKNHVLNFYAGGRQLEPNGGLISATSQRRTKKSNSSAGSTYYEIRGTHFDYAELVHAGVDVTGRALIVPKYQEVQQGIQSFTFAVDFGTSNTHIAYTSGANQPPKEFSITANDQQLVMLNKPSEDSSLTDYQRFHKRGFGRLFAVETLLKREFIPLIINAGGSLYSFPTRTATCESIDFENQIPSLFGNINIGFSINTEGTHQDQYKQNYHTDLKWSETLSNTGKRRIEAFFTEIMLLIKNKVVLNHGNVANTRVVWFAPLSFDDYSRNMFQNVWDGVYSSVFKNGRNTACITESVAPFYFLSRTGAVVPSQDENLINVDIGGGTTDVLLFTNRKPSHSASFRFAGNDLWGDGFASVKTSKDNGLLQYGVAHVLQIPLSEEGKEYKKFLETALDNPDFNSADITSLLFSYDKELHYSSQLLQARQLRLMFYLHFGSLMYHLAQLTQQIGAQVPRYICFSGQGSLYIKLLSAGNNLSNVERYAKTIFRKVTGQEPPANFKLVLVDNPKQVTANGGAMALEGNNLSDLTDIPIMRPTGAATGEDALRPVNKSQITSAIRQEVLSNVMACLELLLDDADIAPQMRSMGVEVDPHWVLNFMRNHIQDSYTMVLEETLRGLSDRELIPETMFFMPLKQSLYLLSKELYQQQVGALV
ncbi:cell division protein FtsA [Rufibacter sp. XAAS-G3-1]|uniref:cell division protein FtsA n=1 Tax=Rufibacter sp. XAAS-G3-1 TaxID=2729134 RepID=UPI0015E76103|nr:cell division protein FtsA [Rufibacter sp. XAAS-G3-1]